MREPAIALRQMALNIDAAQCGTGGRDLGFGMFANLAIGFCLIAACVLCHTGGLMVLSAITPGFAKALGFHNHDLGRSLTMTGSVLGIFSLHTVEVWTWAGAYYVLGTAANFGDALDISTAMFATLGYGSVPVPSAWRLLTALEGIAGFILIGWSTAYLVGVSTRHGPFRKEEHF